MSSVFSKKEYSLALLLVAASVMVALYVTSKYSEQPDLYANLPSEVQLKAEPKDVIYAEGYVEVSGKSAVRYAYITEEVPVDEGEDVSRRTPSSKTYVLDSRVDEQGTKTETLRTEFVSKPQYYNKGGEWKQIEYATTTEEVFAMSGAIKYVERREWWERLLPGKPVFAQTSTYYPDADVESTSFDSSTTATAFDLQPCSIGVAFGDARTATNGLGSDTTVTLSVSSSASADGEGCNATITRSLVLFDTSALPDSAEISSATFSVYVTTKLNQDNDGTDYVRLSNSAPSSNTALSASDYSQVGNTAYASDVDITGISASAYLDMSLNASGIANISLTGVSKFGLKEGHDVTGSTPLSGSTNSVTMSSADASGTSQDPKLAVTYTANSFSFGQWFPF